jgi:hypothetical protein
MLTLLTTVYKIVLEIGVEQAIQMSVVHVMLTLLTTVYKIVLASGVAQRM